MEKIELKDLTEYANSLFDTLERLHSEHNRSSVYKRLKLYDNRFDMTVEKVSINNEYHCESMYCASEFLKCLGYFLRLDCGDASALLTYEYIDPKFSNIKIKTHPKAVNNDGSVDIIIYVNAYYEINNDAERETTDNNDEYVDKITKKPIIDSNDEYVDKITISDPKGHALHFKIKGGKIKWRN